MWLRTYVWISEVEKLSNIVLLDLAWFLKKTWYPNSQIIDRFDKLCDIFFLHLLSISFGGLARNQETFFCYLLAQGNRAVWLYIYLLSFIFFIILIYYVLYTYRYEILNKNILTNVIILYYNSPHISLTEQSESLTNDS